MPLDLDALTELNRPVREELGRREALAAEREAQARREVEDCERERSQVAVDRSALDRVEELHRQLSGSRPAGEGEREVGSGLTPSPDSDLKAKPLRARVGPQRYLMLVAIRDRGSASPEEVAEVTGLQLRRVRDQLSDDREKGFVAIVDDGGLALTARGVEQLAVFEAAKASRGERLPTFEDAVAEADAPPTGEAEGRTDIGYLPGGPD